MDDALTQIETAFRTVLEQVTGGPVLGPEDFPLSPRDLPATIFDLGSERVTYLGEAEGGERVIQRELQVDVMTAHDAAPKEFRAEARGRSNLIRAGLSDPSVLGLPVDDLRLVGVQPQEFATSSEKGLAGGFHHAFAVTFVTRENTPGVLEPRQ